MINNKGVGIWKLKHFRDGILLNEVTIKNLTTYVGRNYLLGAAFTSVTPIATWFAGLIDNSGFTGVDLTDTMASHIGWAESIAYTEATRRTWTANSIVNGSITNGVAMTFTVNASGVLAGFFITSSNTKSGTAGTLWCAGILPSTTLTVNAADVLQVTYSYTIT